MNFTINFNSKKNEIIKTENDISILLSSTTYGGKDEWIIDTFNEIVEENLGDEYCFYATKKSCFGAIIFDTINLSQDTYNRYSKILNFLEKYNAHFTRAWNFIPEINKNNDNTYKQFNEGRIKAFQTKNTNTPPAATGIDIGGDKVVIIFYGGKKPVEIIDNSSQVLPQKYPKKYGAFSPIFSRATLLKDDINKLFISGTSSITGSKTLHHGNIEKQTQLTIDNIKILLSNIDFFNKKSFNHKTIVYFRHEKDLDTIKHYLSENGDFLQEKTFVQANICRIDLDVEISFTFDFYD